MSGMRHQCYLALAHDLILCLLCFGHLCWHPSFQGHAFRCISWTVLATLHPTRSAMQSFNPADYCHNNCAAVRWSCGSIANDPSVGAVFLSSQSCRGQQQPGKGLFQCQKPPPDTVNQVVVCRRPVIIAVTAICVIGVAILNSLSKRYMTPPPPPPPSSLMCKEAGCHMRSCLGFHREVMTVLLHISFISPLLDAEFTVQSSSS